MRDRKVVVHPSSPPNPELLLRWLLSYYDEVDSLCLIYRTKGDLRVRSSVGFSAEDAALASGLLMSSALEVSGTVYSDDVADDGRPMGDDWDEDEEGEDPAS